MNIENFKLLKATLEAQKAEGYGDNFKMEKWFQVEVHSLDTLHGVKLYLSRQNNGGNTEPNFCNTAACLAGTCALIAGDENVYTSAYIFARHWLGLSILEANYVFMGGWNPRGGGRREDLEKITIDEAIEYLDRVIETGKLK